MASSFGTFLLTYESLLWLNKVEFLISYLL